MANKTSETLLLCENEVDEKMKEVITNRMQKRDQARASEAQQKKSLRNEGKVAEEKSSFFTKHFQDEIKNLYNMLLCQDLDKENRSIVLEHFDALTASYQRLQKFFNDSVLFLPRYDSEKAKSQLTELLEEIDKKRMEMLPKKKFAFKSKSKLSSGGSNKKENISHLKENAAKKYASAAMQLRDDCVIQKRTDETITLKSKEVYKKDISLSHLSNCNLSILGTPGTVHINDVSGCTFMMGPVSGSVFVDRCVDSTIATGCQQLRVHHTKNTDFYLHVTSRAIIEDTDSVRFAPYTLLYPGLDEHYALSGLDRSVNNWNDVDDFNWLAMDTQSPNWKILEESSRKQLKIEI